MKPEDLEAIKRRCASDPKTLYARDASALVAEVGKLRTHLAHAWSMAKCREYTMHSRCGCDGCKEIREALGKDADITTDSQSDL